MEIFLNILMGVIFFVACIGIRVWLDIRGANKITTNLKKNVECCIAASRAIGIDELLVEECVDSVRWKDCFIVFAYLMFLDMTVRAAGKVTKSDAATIETYMECCGSTLRGMLSEADLMVKLRGTIEPIAELEDNGDIEHIQQVYKTAFAKALNISPDSKTTSFSLNLLAKQFGIWL